MSRWSSICSSDRATSNTRRPASRAYCCCVFCIIIFQPHMTTRKKIGEASSAESLHSSSLSSSSSCEKVRSEEDKIIPEKRKSSSMVASSSSEVTLQQKNEDSSPKPKKGKGHRPLSEVWSLICDDPNATPHTAPKITCRFCRKEIRTWAKARRAIMHLKQKCAPWKTFLNKYESCYNSDNNLMPYMFRVWWLVLLNLNSRNS